MRSKAPLVLMEQMVMILVFALAAALCVQVFVLSDQTSGNNDARAQALTTAQNAVETLKHCGGDYEAAAQRMGGSWNGEVWEVSCDANWDVVTEDVAAYLVQVTPVDSTTALLGSAEVAVYTVGGEQLCVLPAAWQEVA